MDVRRTGVTFTGGALASFGYFFLFLILFLLILPGAWGAVPFAAWWTANLAFDDGTRAEFTGRAGQAWVLFAVLALLAYLPGIATAILGKGERAQLMELVLTLALIPLDAAVKLAVYRWFIENIRLSPGGSPRFTATYPGYLGWVLLLGLSFLTIIGWAWAAVGMVRWFCRHIESQAYGVSFAGTGWGLLWRSVLWLLGTVCVIPLPWVMRSTIAWWTNNLVLTHAADPAIEDDFPVYGTA
ncbi:MAG: hypothetical protein ACLGQH_04095 [Acidobacteriota bacterium]